MVKIKNTKSLQKPEVSNFRKELKSRLKKQILNTAVTDSFYVTWFWEMKINSIDNHRKDLNVSFDINELRSQNMGIGYDSALFMWSKRL